MVYICTICSDLLESKTDSCASIPCGHTFHRKCLLAWFNVGVKCPICSRVTKKEQILSPIFLSSDGESKNKTSEELKALVVVANVQRRDKEDSLTESRIANKYLKEELEKQHEVIRSMAVANAESLRAITKDRDSISVQLANAKLTIKTKEAEIEKLKKEAQKQITTVEPSATKPSPFGLYINNSGGEKVSLFTSFPTQAPTPPKALVNNDNNTDASLKPIFSFGKLNLGQASGPSDNTNNNNNSSLRFGGFGPITTDNNANNNNTGSPFNATPRETSNNANHAVYRGFGAPRENNNTSNSGGFAGFGAPRENNNANNNGGFGFRPLRPTRLNNTTNNQPQAAATPANT